ncbi:hypothetical protein FRC01_003798 [Tulasnella sp. 417]|nr:hypothetical protein FRC01_003798 [Tulasnella sp. 417]
MPVEIFQIIIWIVMEEYLSRPIPKYYQALTRMSPVCRRWAVILEETPDLWTRLSPDMDERLIDLLLSRSMQSPLTIIGDGLFSSRVVDKLLQHIHRWRALDAKYLDKDTSDHLSVHPAPLLEELKLGLLSFGPPILLFNGSAPRLRIVHICDYGVQWRTSVFSNLHELELSRILQGGPDVDTFLHILANSPMLTRLGVRDTRFTHSPQSQTRVPLPHLRDLKLENLEQDVLKQLVDAIDIPTATNCFFSVALIHGTLIQDAMNPNYQILEPIFQRLKTLTNVSIGTRSTLTFGEPLPGSNLGLTMTYEGEADQHGSLTAQVATRTDRRLAVRVARYFARLLAQSVPNLVPPALHIIYPLDRAWENLYEDRIFRKVGEQLPDIEEILIEDRSDGHMRIALDLLFPIYHYIRPFYNLSTLRIRTVSHGEWAHWLQRRQERRVKEGGVYRLPLQTLILEGGRIKAGKIEVLRKLVPTLVLNDVEIR